MPQFPLEVVEIWEFMITEVLKEFESGLVVQITGVPTPWETPHSLQLSQRKFEPGEDQSFLKGTSDSTWGSGLK